MSSAIQIQGIKDLTRLIKNIPDDRMKRRELLKILRRQAKPVLREVKNAAPISKDYIRKANGDTYKRKTKSNQRTYAVPQNNLKKSFAIITGKSKVYPHVKVGPRRGKKYKFDGWYAHMVLYGTIYQKGDDFIKRASDKVMPMVSKTASEEVRKYAEKKVKQIKYIK